jgi:hypothetical protein|tara:strand:+ start:1494 stop:2177 length:684 start_codon:yes stop_codon:yes gene_type:complete
MSKSISLKIPKMDKLLNDKNVLYTVFVIAILNLLGYLMVKNVEAVMFFLIIGFLTTYFSKNMIIVLIITIVSTSIFASTRTTYIQGPVTKEGMSTQRSATKDKLKDKLKENAEEKSKTNTKSPPLPAPDSKVSTRSSKTKNRVDYAGTLEEAYSNLQKHVGDGGIEGLTAQTSTLLSQQKELMENISGMQPFLKTAESFMQNMDMSSLDGITGMLSKLTGKTEEDLK